MDTAWQKFKNNIPLRRFVVLLLIIACLYEIRAMMNTGIINFYFYLCDRAFNSSSAAVFS